MCARAFARSQRPFGIHCLFILFAPYSHILSSAILSYSYSHTLYLFFFCLVFSLLRHFFLYWKMCSSSLSESKRASDINIEHRLHAHTIIVVYARKSLAITRRLWNAGWQINRTGSWEGKIKRARAMKLPRNCYDFVHSTSRTLKIQCTFCDTLPIGLSLSLSVSLSCTLWSDAMVPP